MILLTSAAILVQVKMLDSQAAKKMRFLKKEMNVTVKKKNKADIPLQFLFWTIVALLLFIPAVIFGSKLLMPANQGQNYYLKLVNLVERTQVNNMASMPLFMEEDTAIWGFGKDGDFELTEADHVLLTSKRPTECKKGNSCLCLCKEGLDVKDNLVECKKYICNSLNSEFFTIIHPSYPTNSNLEIYNFKNGFYILRAKTNRLMNYYPNTDVSDKMRTVYVQNYKGKVAVCERNPCITDDIKKIIDAPAAVSEPTP
jgi:hypothetical protein